MITPGLVCWLVGVFFMCFHRELRYVAAVIILTQKPLGYVGVWGVS